MAASPDSFHRLAKSLIDSGESDSVSEAMETFSHYGVRIRLRKDLVSDPAAQMIALTAINAAARSFQGNVIVESDDAQLKVRGFEGSSLYSFMNWAGIKASVAPEAALWPTISVGHSDGVPPNAISVWADDWRFGLGNLGTKGTAFAPACVAAGGLAVSEAFSLLRQDNPYAGRRRIALSLWQPGHDSPAPEDLKSSIQQGALWLLGLGHLGQAYAWILGFMKPTSAPLCLQDIDLVTPSTVSTSLLSTANDIGRLKTRVVSDWLENRGHQTLLVERRFDEHQRVAPDEPTVALFGVDNPSARRVLEGFGMRLVIDAGLGAGFNDFRAFRVRTFPGPSRAADLWAKSTEVVKHLAPAYQRLVQEGADPCGVTTLASRSVGAPFVGCVAAGYVLAERVRRQLGGQALGFVDMNLRSPNHIETD